MNQTLTTCPGCGLVIDAAPCENCAIQSNENAEQRQEVFTQLYPNDWTTAEIQPK